MGNVNLIMGSAWEESHNVTSLIVKPNPIFVTSIEQKLIVKSSQNFKIHTQFLNNKLRKQ